jgi:hypothetical protein
MRRQQAGFNLRSATVPPIGGASLSPHSEIDVDDHVVSLGEAALLSLSRRQQERLMTVRRASAASGPAPSYEGDDRTNQDHNSSSDRENSNPLPDPALFPFIRRHVTSLMFFSTFLASLLSQNMPIVDLKYPLALRFSLSNPQ